MASAAGSSYSATVTAALAASLRPQRLRLWRQHFIFVGCCFRDRSSFFSAAASTAGLRPLLARRPRRVFVFGDCGFGGNSSTVFCYCGFTGGSSSSVAAAFALQQHFIFGYRDCGFSGSAFASAAVAFAALH